MGLDGAMEARGQFSRKPREQSTPPEGSFQELESCSGRLPSAGHFRMRWCTQWGDACRLRVLNKRDKIFVFQSHISSCCPCPAACTCSFTLATMAIRNNAEQRWSGIKTASKAAAHAHLRQVWRTCSHVLKHAQSSKQPAVVYSGAPTERLLSRLKQEDSLRNFVEMKLQVAWQAVANTVRWGETLCCVRSTGTKPRFCTTHAGPIP